MIRDVLVAGGGTGGLETALALRAFAPDRLRVLVLAPGRHLVRRAIAGADVHAVRLALADAAQEHGFGLVRDAVERVDVPGRSVLTQGGECHAYDALVLAVGARATAAVPGALTFRGPADLERLRDALGRSGGQRFGGPRVAVTAPPGGQAAGGPLSVWELGLVVARLLPRGGRVVVAAPGTAPPDAVLASALAAAGVRTRAYAVPRRADGRGLWLQGEAAPEPADVVVALPGVVGPALAGLPADDRGFVRVDAAGRVPGAPDVYAVGGMTGRRAGATAEGADRVARRLAAWAGAPVASERRAGPAPSRLETLFVPPRSARASQAASAA